MTSLRKRRRKKELASWKEKLLLNIPANQTSGRDWKSLTVPLSTTTPLGGKKNVAVTFGGFFNNNKKKREERRWRWRRRRGGGGGVLSLYCWLSLRENKVQFFFFISKYILSVHSPVYELTVRGFVPRMSTNSSFVVDVGFWGWMQADLRQAASVPSLYWPTPFYHTLAILFFPDMTPSGLTLQMHAFRLLCRLSYPPYVSIFAPPPYMTLL